MISEVDASELDTWLAKPAVRVSHRWESSADPDRLWEAARSIELRDTRMLGRLVRWRIPGVPSAETFDQLFREPPFLVLTEEHERALISGLVGRIWTLRRDYPTLSGTDEFQAWSKSGTAKVVFANWVEDGRRGGAVLRSEARVQAFGVQGRVGLGSVRPMIRGFQQLVANDAMAAAVRRAEST
jgi:hypothetical protein